MSTEEHIPQFMAQITALQAQLAHCSQSPPPAPAQPSAAPPPPPKPPKVSAPSPFSGAQDDLDCFKAKCSLYLSMRQSKFPDEHSNVLFILLYMKGGSAGPWATQKINSILYPANMEEVTWAGFILELDKMFADPAHQPIDLDHTNPVKKDPHSSLCLNCGKLGHIAKVCRGPHTQNVWNIDAVMTLRLTPKDLQLLIESIRVVMVSSAPMTPLCESE